MAIYNSDHSCQEISIWVDLATFANLDAFFLVFIWFIFKLLAVWRVMTKDCEEEQKKERRRLHKIQAIYIATWLAFWSVQRYLEYRIIEKQRLNHSKSSQMDATHICLILFNLLALLMELALYLSLF